MEPNYYLEVGNLIKKLREKQNISKSELAKGICSASYITKIEKGIRCPSSVILRQIANKLGLSSEYLFRTIESPTSIQISELLNQIFLYDERRELKKIYKLIKEKEKELCIESIHDRQIIESFKSLIFNHFNKNPQQGLKEIKGILSLTYKEGTFPNDIEFILLFYYGIFLYQNNQYEEAYNHLIDIQKYIDKIILLHTYTVVPDFYVLLIEVCLDLSKLNECIEYINTAINYCKKYNTHAILRELYFFKGELYYRLKKENEANLWFNKAFTLHELIGNGEDDDYFHTFIYERTEILKKAVSK